MDLFQQEIDNFQKIVQIADEATMILKAHLLTEQSLWKFIASRVNNEILVLEFQDENSPVKNGKALIQLAQALSARDEIPSTECGKMWTSLYKVNSIRNKLVHELDPDRRKVDKHIRELSRAVLGNESESLQQDFYDATLLLIGQLGLERQPTDLSDFDSYEPL